MKPKPLIITLSTALAIVIGLGIWWVVYLHRAHSTFDNYYAFRGCQQLITKTAA